MGSKKVEKILKKIFYALLGKWFGIDIEDEDKPKPAVDVTAEVKEPVNEPEPVATAKPEVAEKPKNNMPPGKVVGKQWSDDPYNNYEPPSTGKLGTIKSFLWKPKSDVSPGPVIVVSCDLVPRDELHLEILGRSGANISKKSRGNKLHTYGRINFYLHPSFMSGTESESFNVRFYQNINGSKEYLPIKFRGGHRGHEITVHNIRKRQDEK